MGKLVLIIVLVVYAISLLIYSNPKIELVEGYKSRYLMFYYTTKNKCGDLQRKSIILITFNKKNPNV